MNEENLASQRVETLLELGRFEQAVTECTKALGQHPESIELLSQLVRGHLGNTHFHEAEKACQRLVRAQPEYAFAHYLHSLTLHNLKHFDGELASAKEAARLEPQEPHYLYRLAESQMQSGLLKEARATANQALKLAPNDFGTLHLLGNLELELDQYSEAEQYFLAALRLQPDDAASLNQLAITLRCQKREKEAIDMLFLALKQHSADDTLQYNLFEYIKYYLDRKTVRGGRKKALRELPVPVQMFFQDYQKRTSIFNRYSNMIMVGFWIVIIALIWGVTALLDKG